jgi:hypothetical protein
MDPLGAGASAVLPLVDDHPDAHAAVGRVDQRLHHAVRERWRGLLQGRQVHDLVDREADVACRFGDGVEDGGVPVVGQDHETWTGRGRVSALAGEGEQRQDDGHEHCRAG